MKNWMQGILMMCLTFGGATEGIAKDAFGLLQQIEGFQVVQATWVKKGDDCADGKLSATKKVRPKKSSKLDWIATDTCKTTTTSELIEFAYVGGNELWVVRPEGKEEAIIPGFGAQNISWSAPGGYIYEIGESNGPLVEGTVWSGNSNVGTFTLVPSKVAQHPLDGRWHGEMGFPGGFVYPLNLMSAGTLRPLSEGCGLLDARMEFGHAPYADLQITTCVNEEKSNQEYSMVMLYLDTVSGSTWFLSFTGVLESGAFQGSLTAMPLFGGDIQEGVFILFPPTSFLGGTD